MQVRPLVERLGPGLRRARFGVMSAVQRVEELLVPALLVLSATIALAVTRTHSRLVPGLLGLARGAPRAIERGDEALVAAVTGVARALPAGMGRAEGWLVPAVAGLTSQTFAVVSRGELALATGLGAGARLALDGLQRVEAAAGTGLAERPAGPARPPGETLRPARPDGPARPPEGPTPPARPARVPRGEAQPAQEAPQPSAALVRPPLAPQAAFRLRASSAAANLFGMAATAGLVVLALLLAGNAAVPEAAERTGGAVDLALRLPEDPTLLALGERSYVYAANGQELQVLDREENRRLVDLADIPLPVQQAILTAEDQRFYEHEGYDPGGISRALMANIEAGDVTQGGSTITQQLAKSAVGNDVTLARKFEELAYAVALEQEFTKDQLLGQYLNQVYFGENAYGVAAAAEEYFGITDVTQLRAEHGALLAAMIRSPNNANPRTAPDVATRRRDVILEQMVPQGFLTQAEADAATALPLGVVEVTSRVRPYDFIADSVIREFLSAPELAQFGATLEDRERALYFSGLRIHSTLDTRIQDIAQQVVGRNFPTPTDPNQPTGALVTVEPSTGRILAAHSGVAYGTNQQSIPTQGRRQLGSAAKPFVYAEALRQGIPANIRIDGSSPAYFENCPEWTRADGGVQNSGGRSREVMDMFTALAGSVNTPAVRVSQMVSPERVVGLMGEMGVDTLAAIGPAANCAIALGGFETGVTPLEAASAYATFANGGVHVRPHFIDRIDDRFGNPVYTAQHPGRQVLSAEQNAVMVRMMEGVVSGGTGTRAAVPGWPVAGKTGTTTAQKDAWFVGVTPNLATAMWVGVPAAGRPLPAGSGLAAQLWSEYMSSVLSGQAPVGFPAVGVVDGRVAAGTPTTVPGVTGLTVTDALPLLNGARLGGEPRPVPNGAPAGTVVGQTPPAGTPVTSGDNVILDVSTGGAPPPA